jgi:hypothetical protein
MLNPTTNTMIKLAQEAHDRAARALELAAKKVREHGSGPMADLYSDELDRAMEAYEQAADDLRETRDGYRHTYPHPVALAPHGRRYPVG